MTTDSTDMSLADVFKLPKEETLNTFHKRMVSIPTTALETLKQELLQSMGEERSKGIFIRYGWHTGMSDGEKVRSMDWDDKMDLINAGPRLHILHGYLEKVVIDDIKFDSENNMEYIDLSWFNSYEAESHLEENPESPCPVCHTLCGYASGYLSAVLQKTILVKETGCRAMGHDHCKAVCMPLDKWGEEQQNEYRYYQSASMIKELDAVTAKLKEERDYLSRGNEVHRKLIEELLSKQDLQNILNLLERETGLPAFIEDGGHKIVKQSDGAVIDFELKGLDTRTTEYMEVSSGTGLLRTPIYLENKIQGYCSFIYTGEHTPSELDRMIIDQAALTASIIRLNENIKINTEQNIRRGFLNDVLDGRLDKEELYKYAQYMDIDPDANYWMMTLERNINEAELSNEVEASETLIRYITLFFRERSMEAFAAQKSNRIIIVMECSSFKKIFSSREAFIKKLLKYCTARLKDYKFFAGVSSSSNGLQELPVLHKETLTALNAKSANKQIIFYEELGIESVLFQISDDQLINRFVDKQIGRLLKEDPDLELVNTLQDYIENGMNINATAKAISMSISGLRYRLGKISEILEIELDDTKNLFSVYMALNILSAQGKI
ncbi:XylR N-terminal domain-containing protein [Salinicoccus bachuensis]|uniref:XylR N-terminal domain-containing protein n=1 Tax=Salinicoccus bachuensis TaxID=3136731 RepID=A0ABZ3CHJ1_9STAP